MAENISGMSRMTVSRAVSLLSAAYISLIKSSLPFSTFPSVIIIFTDGEAYYPDESAAMGIPVLWMLNNYDNTPPWGKTVRCVVD